MARTRILDQIRILDPVADCQRVVFLSTCYEFPFDTTRALEFALFRTYCVPSISGLLDRTGEFRARPQKRYDDTDLIVSELMEHGYDSDRGRSALRRMNGLHGRFAIANDDFLYVLSTFIYEPIRWNAKFGWRPMIEAERLGHFHFWREVGRRMNIQAIPEDYDEFEAFNRDYEATQFRFTDANNRVGEATRELFASWFPRPFAPLVRGAVLALLDPPLIEAFGFPKPSPLMKRVVPAAVRLRGRIAGWLPERKRPRLRTEIRHRSYPKGYEVVELGPPSDAIEG